MNMIVKKFLVKTAAEAQELIKREMGPNAVILTTRHIHSKEVESFYLSEQIEVIAAVDEEDLDVFNRLKTQGELHVDKNISNENVSNQKLLNEKHLKDLERIKTDLFKMYGSALPEESKVISSLDSQNLIQKFDELQIKKKTTELSSQRNLKDLEDYLVLKGVFPFIARELQEKVDAYLSKYPKVNDTEHYLGIIEKQLTSKILTSGPFCISQGAPTIAAIVGPSGIGKTTTLIKIALQYVEDLDKKVAIISIDKQIGALEQTTALTEKFGLPFSFANDAEKLLQVIQSYNDFDLILIDTYGCSFNQQSEIQSLVEFLKDIQNLQVHLAVSMTAKEADLLETIKQFIIFLPESIIFTKLDETLTHGDVVNVCHNTKIAISYLTNGQDLTHDLLLADPNEIAHYILRDFKPLNYPGMKAQETILTKNESSI